MKAHCTKWKEICKNQKLQYNETDIEEINVPFDQSIEDSTENCCKLGPNKFCYKQFPREMLIQAREESLELTDDEIDIAVLGQLRALRPLDKKMKQVLHTVSICHAASNFIHAIKHHSVRGLSPRVHKHKENTPHNVTTNENMTNYASQHNYASQCNHE